MEFNPAVGTISSWTVFLKASNKDREEETEREKQVVKCLQLKNLLILPLCMNAISSKHLSFLLSFYLTFIFPPFILSIFPYLIPYFLSLFLCFFSSCISFFPDFITYPPYLVSYVLPSFINSIFHMSIFLYLLPSVFPHIRSQISIARRCKSYRFFICSEGESKCAKKNIFLLET